MGHSDEQVDHEGSRSVDTRPDEPVDDSSATFIDSSRGISRASSPFPSSSPSASSSSPSSFSSSSSLLHQLRSFLALEKEVLAIFLAVLLVSLGEQLWSEYLPTYFIALGGTAILLGLFKSLSSALDALAQLPGGIISDKIGRISAALLFFGMGILGYTLYLTAPSWIFLFVGLIFVQGTSSLLQPTIFSIIGDNLRPEKWTNAFSVQSILKRLPIVVAPFLGGVLIDHVGVLLGVRIGLGITVSLSLLAAWIIWSASKELSSSSARSSGSPRQAGPTTTATKKRQTSQSNHRIVQNTFSHLFSPQLSRLLVGDSLARFGSMMIKVFIALYVIKQFGATIFGLLIGVQMTVSILSYLPAAYLAEKIGRKPVMLVTFLCFSLYPVMIFFSTTFWAILLAFSVLGLKEFGEPARKALIVNLSSLQETGTNVGLYYTIRSLVIIPAGIIGGWIWQYSPQYLGTAGSFVAFLGFLIVLFFVNEDIKN